MPLKIEQTPLRHWESPLKPSPTSGPQLIFNGSDSKVVKTSRRIHPKEPLQGTKWYGD